MFRNVVHSDTYAKQCKEFRDIQRFEEVCRAIEWAAGLNAELIPLVANSKTLRILLTDSVESSLYNIPQFRVALKIRNDEYVDLLGIGQVPQDDE